MTAPVEVTATRGGVVESRHRVHVALADAQGRLLAAAGDCDLVTFLRSSAKPLQAVPLVASGAAAAFGLDSGDLAIACASHIGAGIHLEAAARLLAKAGLGPQHLRCGAHPPEDAAERARLGGHPPQRLHNNCSGKHAGMLAVCAHLGWDLDGYLDPEHPLQQAIRGIVAEAAGVQPILGVDGCGVPTFGLPLHAMATAFARLGCGAGLPDAAAAAAAPLAEAMAARPELISGPGQFNTEFLRHRGHEWLTKGGAEGVWCAGRRGPAPGLGLALKVEDGAGRAAPPAFLAVLAACGLPGGQEADARFCRPALRNTLGAEVGSLAATVPAGLPATLRQGMAAGA